MDRKDIVNKDIDKKAFEWLENRKYTDKEDPSLCLHYNVWNNKYRNGNETFDQWLDRVSNKDEEIRTLILDKKFLFGGRILANRGVADSGSYSNCYSLGFIEDSIEGVFTAAKDLAHTFKSEGGQGLSLSKIRPKGCLIKGKHESDGILPFMRVFNTTVGSISQGNSRRGALLMSLDIWHKEASNFIKIKSDLNEINNANLSLEIDDEFMQLVSDYYDKKLQDKPIKHVVKEYSGNKIEYDVDVIALYKELCKHAREYAEPGILFVSPYRNYILAQHHSEYKIETGNACSEQSLPKHGACNLCSFNLYAYVKNPFTDDAYFDKDSFENDIPKVVRAMDDILDENLNNHPLYNQKAMSYDYRNIGIGFMGLADAFMALGYTYGDKNSVGFTQAISKLLFRTAVEASSQLASTKGRFPKYEESIWESDIIKNAFTDKEIKEYKAKGLRNVALLSIAPTGSIGTMLGLSTGIEPEFALSYKRRTLSLNGKETVYKEDAKIVKDYKNIVGNPNASLPSYIITSYDIPWKDRIAVQAAAQKYIDTAISSTCNLPKNTTAEEVEQIYLEAWRQGLKGFTIYRDGSRDPILFTEDSSIKTIGIVSTKAPERPKELPADFHLIKYKGEQFTVAVGLLEDKPYEIFAFRMNIIVNNMPSHKGKIIRNGSDNYSFVSDYINIKNLAVELDNMEEKANTIYPSLALRNGVSIEEICKTMGKLDDNIASFSASIIRVLRKYEAAKELEEKCPKCGSKVIREGGCKHCSNMECSWSACGD